MVHSNLPVIDVTLLFAEKSSDPASEDLQTLIKRFDEAFCKYGACVCVGHSISNALVNNLTAQTKEWFETQDQASKAEYSYGYYGNPQGGYSAVGLEAVAASIEGKSAKGKVDAVESFVFNGVPSLFVKPGEVAPNSACPLFSSADEYVAKVTQLRQCLHRLCCLALGIEREDFFDRTFYNGREHGDALRLAYYPPETGASTSAVAGASVADPAVPLVSPSLRYGAHTDYQDLTILKPDYDDWLVLPGQEEAAGAAGAAGAASPPPASHVATTGGLQILPRGAPETEASWRAVLLDHDSSDAELDAPLIINIGDFWNAWSADRWRSPVHRVTKEGTLLPLRALSKAKEAPTSTPTTTPTTVTTASASAAVAVARERQAIVFFSIPKASSMVQPLQGRHIPDFSTTEPSASASNSNSSNPYHPAVYTPVCSSEHLATKIARSNV